MSIRLVPKTALGFLAIMASFVVVGTLATVAIEASTESLNHLVPYTLAAGFMFVVAIVATVFVFLAKSPTSLVLGSGNEEALTNYLILGDSSHGERIDILRAQGFDTDGTAVEIGGAGDPLPAPLSPTATDSPIESGA